MLLYELQFEFFGKTLYKVKNDNCVQLLVIKSLVKSYWFPCLLKQTMDNHCIRGFHVIGLKCKELSFNLVRTFAFSFIDNV